MQIQQETLKPASLVQKVNKETFFISDCSSGEISIDVLKKEMKYFSGGQWKIFYTSWSTLTNDKFIFDIISESLKLDFKDFPSENYLYPRSEKE